MTQSEVPMVLQLEDSPVFIKAVADCIGSRTRLLSAPSLVEAEKAFLENRDELAMIIFGGNIIGGTTVELARRIKEEYGFQGVMVAASTSDELNGRLMKAGCAHCVDKSGLYDFLKTMVCLQPA